MRGEAVGVLVLPQELVGRHRLGADRLQRHLLARRAVLSQVHAREPALADLLHHVVLGVQVDLQLRFDILSPAGINFLMCECSREVKVDLTPEIDAFNKLFDNM